MAAPPAPSWRCRRRPLLGAALALPAMVSCAGRVGGVRGPLLDGVVWQVSRATVRPRGRWHLLGAHALLVQWAAVDGWSFVEGGGLPMFEPPLPDWSRIAQEPWAQEVVLGLSGIHDERQARAEVPKLGRQSRALAQAAARLPLRIGEWYFPVELDPTWQNAEQLGPALAGLPRPLWISAYDSANLGPEALADWLQRWLPNDVGVFFQDGVGVHAREPAVALEYCRTLAKRLEVTRVRIIAEAFRPAPGGGFRSATALEFMAQLRTYQGWSVWAFDGPHYLNDALVDELLGLALQMANGHDAIRPGLT